LRYSVRGFRKLRGERGSGVRKGSGDEKGLRGERGLRGEKGLRGVRKGSPVKVSHYKPFSTHGFFSPELSLKSLVSG
jgi:hypothetical protein